SRRPAREYQLNPRRGRLEPAPLERAHGCAARTVGIAPREQGGRERRDPRGRRGHAQPVAEPRARAEPIGFDAPRRAGRAEDAPTYGAEPRPARNAPRRKEAAVARKARPPLERRRLNLREPLSASATR